MTFYLYNDIWNWTAQDFADKNAEIDSIEINSAGGDVFAALTIMNMLKEKDIPVKVRGLCASAATLICCGAKKVTAAENSLFMIHEPRVWLSNLYSAKELETLQTSLEKLTASLELAYKSRLQEVDLSVERWLTAAEAKEIGLIDEIEGAVEVTAKNDLLFVNKCVFRMAESVKATAAEKVVAQIKEQMNSGSLGVLAQGQAEISAKEMQMQKILAIAKGLK